MIVNKMTLAWARLALPLECVLGSPLIFLLLSSQSLRSPGSLPPL